MPSPTGSGERTEAAFGKLCHISRPRVIQILNELTTSAMIERLRVVNVRGRGSERQFFRATPDGARSFTAWLDTPVENTVDLAVRLAATRTNRRAQLRVVAAYEQSVAERLRRTTAPAEHENWDLRLMRDFDARQLRAALDWVAYAFGVLEQESSAVVTLLAAHNLTKRYDDRRSVTAVDNASFDIAQGELVTIYGPRLSGRSTLLRLAAGVEPPDSGTVVFDGENLQLHSAFWERARVLRHLCVGHAGAGLSPSNWSCQPFTSSGDGMPLGRARRRCCERVGAWDAAEARRPRASPARTGARHDRAGAARLAETSRARRPCARRWPHGARPAACTHPVPGL